MNEVKLLKSGYVISVDRLAEIIEKIRAVHNLDNGSTLKASLKSLRTGKVNQQLARIGLDPDAPEVKNVLRHAVAVDGAVEVVSPIYQHEYVDIFGEKVKTTDAVKYFELAQRYGNRMTQVIKALEAYAQDNDNSHLKNLGIENLSIFLLIAFCEQYVTNKGYIQIAPPQPPQ